MTCVYLIISYLESTVYIYIYCTYILRNIYIPQIYVTINTFQNDEALFEYLEFLLDCKKLITSSSYKN